MSFEMEGFALAEAAMIRAAMMALEGVGYDTSPIKVLIRADLPATYRGMSLPDGAALGTEAFRSQEILNQRTGGRSPSFAAESGGPGRKIRFQDRSRVRERSK